MSYPTNHWLKEARCHAATTSIGATPVACYTAAPFRGRIVKVQAVAQGVITTADCTITIAVNGTTVTALGGTIPVASAAAGQVATWVPSTLTYVNEDDAITITPSGASGASIGGLFILTVQAT